MEEEKVFYYHGKTVDGRRFTVAGVFDKSSKGDLIFGLALCSENDQFVKKTGRHKAAGRIFAESCKGCCIVETPVEKGKEIFTFINNAKVFNTMTVKELQKVFILYEYNKTIF